MNHDCFVCCQFVVTKMFVGPECDMRVLTTKPKRGRRKKLPSALVVVEHDQIVQTEDKNAVSSDDESKNNVHDIAFDECTAVEV